MSDGQVLVVMGPPACGKTRMLEQTMDLRMTRLNRDLIGGRTSGKLLQELERLYTEEGKRRFALDNTYMTVESRRPLLELCKRLGLTARCVWIDADIPFVQFLAARRMVQRHGKLLSSKEIAAFRKGGGDDPNLFPPAAQFAYFKKFEPPTLAEGFADIETVNPAIGLGPGYNGKALFLDYDGTLRDTRSGRIYPNDPDDVYTLPNRAKVLREWQSRGYLLIGVSNQSGISKKPGHEKYVSDEDARACFDRTNGLLDLDIEVMYCPHAAGAPSCYCRKPVPGMGVVFIEKYKLNPAECMMVGDMKTDQTFATRCGFQYTDAEVFFGGGAKARRG